MTHPSRFVHLLIATAATIGLVSALATPRDLRADWTSAIAASNPLNWYTLDESIGLTAYDHGSEGLDGIYGAGANAPIRGQTGLVGAAVEFSGDAENLIATQNILLGGTTLNGDWSAKFVVMKTASSFSQILLKGADNFSPSTALKFEQFPETHQVGYTEFGIEDYLFTPSVFVPANRFVVLDYVRSASGLRLYVDGEFAGANDMPMALDRTRIGDDQYESIWGVLDEVVIYDRALSADEIADHYFAAVPEPSSTLLALAALSVLGAAFHRRRKVR